MYYGYEEISKLSIEELYDVIGSETVANLPNGWQEVTLFVEIEDDDCGMTKESFIDKAGQLQHQFEYNSWNIYIAFDRIRNISQKPGEPKWIYAVLKIQNTGQFTLNFTYPLDQNTGQSTPNFTDPELAGDSSQAEEIMNPDGPLLAYVQHLHNSALLVGETALPTRDDVLKQIKQFWDETVQSDGAKLDIHVNLLTADGREEQPLGYDIIQIVDEEVYTVTWVEKRLEAEKQVGLSNMTHALALETMRNLVVEAHEQPAEIPTETRLVAIIVVDGMGLTYGRHRFTNGRTASFTTNYQVYFTADKLLTEQNETSGGVLFKRVTATFDENGVFSLGFG